MDEILEGLMMILLGSISVTPTPDLALDLVVFKCSSFLLYNNKVSEIRPPDWMFL